MSQGRYWLLTVPQRCFTPWLPDSCCYIKGQLELGEQGYLHWQVLVLFHKNKRLRSVKEVFGDECHAELSRSEAASDYVWKEETRVGGTQFELGKLPFKRNSARDWDSIWDAAKTGNLESIDASVRVCHYGSLRRIASDYLQPVGFIRTVYVFHGPTGTGKSRRAWGEGGLDAYPKDPNTKFWDGYRGQENVIIDEFRGIINISHMLRWLDRYPCIVEVKGSSTVLKARTIWITSNLHPGLWYPDLDQGTRDALIRRLIISEIN